MPEGVSYEHAALTEPLACVVRGLEESCAQSGDTLVVIGAGPIGLMFMHAAQISGLHVIAVVKREEQIAAARTFGAEHVIQTTSVGDPVAAVRALTPNRRGVDIAIEAVAAPVTWQWAVDMVRKGGMVNFFGGPPSGTKVEFDTNRLHYNDITLKAGFHHTPASARKAFELIQSGRFKCCEYITGRASLTEVGDVFRSLMNSSVGIKTAIIPLGNDDRDDSTTHRTGLGGAACRVPDARNYADTRRSSGMVSASNGDALREFPRRFVVPAKTSAPTFSRNLRLLPCLR